MIFHSFTPLWRTLEGLISGIALVMLGIFFWAQSSDIAAQTLSTNSASCKTSINDKTNVGVMRGVRHVAGGPFML